MKKSIALIFALAATSLFAAPKAASNAATKVSKAEAVKNLVDQGVQFHEQGQYDEAIAKYKEAEKKDPKNALVKYEMAFTYHAKRDLDKSLTYAKAATKLKSEGIDENLYSLLGTIYDESAEANTIYASGVDWAEWFNAGDAITLSGCTQTGNNISVIINVNNPYFDDMRFQINPSTLHGKTDPDYRRCEAIGLEIRKTMNQIREGIREGIEAAAAPKVAVTCPSCGASTIPDEKGCCEYCGAALNV